MIKLIQKVLRIPNRIKYFKKVPATSSKLIGLSPWQAFLERLDISRDLERYEKDGSRKRDNSKNALIDIGAFPIKK